MYHRPSRMGALHRALRNPFSPCSPSPSGVTWMNGLRSSHEMRNVGGLDSIVRKGAAHSGGQTPAGMYRKFMRLKSGSVV